MRPGGVPLLASYVLLHAISSVLVVLPFAASSLLEGGIAPAWGLLAFVFALVAYSPFVFVAGAPAALVGCLAIHLLLQGVAVQWVHVVAFAGVGAMTGLLYSLTVVTVPSAFLVPVLATATAIARLCVAPLLRRPVDDDSRPAVPAC